MILYIITNTVTGKRYVGITRTALKTRWLKHLSCARKPVHPLSHAMAKYGAENFTVEHVASAKTWEDLQALERFMIIQENTRLEDGLGYNATSGGERLAGYFQSIETRRRQSEAQRGRKHTPEAKARISQSKIGKPLSPEHRLAVSIAQKGNKSSVGRVLSQETREKISKALTGKVFHTDEFKKFMSLKMKGVPKPPRSFKPKAVARRKLAQERASLEQKQFRLEWEDGN